MKPFADDLLAQATRLLGVESLHEVLALTGREVQRLTGIERLFGSFGTSAAWAAGVHLRFCGSECVNAEPSERSALFGVYRVLARQRNTVTLTRATEATIADALCGENGSSSIVLAFPIINLQRRLCGCLALCIGTPLSHDKTAAVVELAKLAALAFENVQRISAVRRDRERLYLLAEAAEEALWDWSPDTGEFWWGGGLSTLIGGGAIEPRLAWKFEQVHQEDIERVRGSFERALADTDAETWREEYRLLRTGDKWIRVEDHANILRDTSGRAYRVVGAMRDVTELRELLAREQAARAISEADLSETRGRLTTSEQSLGETQGRLTTVEFSLGEIRQSSELREQFIAVLGHDLRNPLGAIGSGIELLQRASLDERHLRVTHMMKRSVGRMTALIDDVLDFARGRLGGGIGLTRDSTQPLAPVLRGVVAELRSHAPAAAIDVDIDIDDPIDCDRGRIAQLFSNLLGNALTYGASDKPIRVRAVCDAGHLELSVANSGAPIPVAAMEHLFQPFYRAAVRASREGLGLGLFIANEIAKAHGGTLEAISTTDETRFTFRMPLDSNSKRGDSA